MRSSMVDVLTEDFVTVKRATGLPWNRVVRSHAVPNALLPLVTLAAIQFGAVAGGAITIETIFSWPGLGDAQLRGDQRQGLPGAAGHLPGLLGRGDPRQPARRLPLLLPRPAGANPHEPRRTGGSGGRGPGPGGVRRPAGDRSRPAARHLEGALRSRCPRAVHLRRDLRQPARPVRPDRVEPRRARSRRASITSWGRPRPAPTSSRRSSSAPGSRSWSASPRR